MEVEELKLSSLAGAEEEEDVVGGMAGDLRLRLAKRDAVYCKFFSLVFAFWCFGFMCASYSNCFAIGGEFVCAAQDLSRSFTVKGPGKGPHT